MFVKYLTKLLLVLGLLISFACSSGGDDDGGPNGPHSEDPPDYVSINPANIPTAMRQSADTYAQQAVAWIDMLNSFHALVILPPVSKRIPDRAAILDYEPNWVLKDTIENLIVTFNVFETEDFYAWDWVFDGTDGVYNYDNWLAMHQECHKTLGFGGFIIYEPVTTDIDLQWSWGYTETEAYALEAVDEGAGEKLDGVVNPDGSGRIAYFLRSGEDWIVQFMADWNTDGSGHWYEYENGEYIDDGTWE